MFVDDLIEQLKKIRYDKGNIRVGMVGHYGEFYDMSKSAIRVRKNDSFEGDATMGETVVVISCPYIGDEPY